MAKRRIRPGLRPRSMTILAWTPCQKRNNRIYKGLGPECSAPPKPQTRAGRKQSATSDTQSKPEVALTRRPPELRERRAEVILRLSQVSFNSDR